MDSTQYPRRDEAKQTKRKQEPPSGTRKLPARCLSASSVALKLPTSSCRDGPKFRDEDPHNAEPSRLSSTVLAVDGRSRAVQGRFWLGIRWV